MTRRSTQFTPIRHGFHFSNSFIDRTVTITFPPLTIPGLPPFPGKTVSKTFGGRCAGMAFTVLDYYWNQSTVPTHSSSDFGSGNTVPNLNNGLGKYIDNRHDTWSNSDPSADEKNARIILLPRRDLLSPPDPMPPFRTHVIAKGAYNFTLDELNDIRLQIDQGNPVPIGLVADQSIDSVSGGNHAVVAYGYDDSNNDLYVYDCNYPDRECVIRANDTDRSFDTFSRESSGWTRQSSWKGYYRKGYARETPSYFDLTIKEEIRCKNNSGVIVTSISTRKSVLAQYKIANSGQYTARLRNYNFSVSKVNNVGEEGGISEDNRIGILDTDTNLNNDITLPSGQEFLVSKTSTVFDIEGVYRIEATFTTSQGEIVWGFHTASPDLTKTWLQVSDIRYIWVTSALTPDGHTEVFGRGSDNGIYHIWQETGRRYWHSPQSLTGAITDNCLAATNFKDGRLLITHRGMDNKLYYRILSPTGWDRGWNCLDGDLAGCPMLIITRPHGKIRIIAQFNDGSLRYREEALSGGWTVWKNF